MSAAVGAELVEILRRQIDAWRAEGRWDEVRWGMRVGPAGYAAVEQWWNETVEPAWMQQERRRIRPDFIQLWGVQIVPSSTVTDVEFYDRDAGGEEHL